MRLESMASRLDFDERRARALEGVVQYRAGAVPPLQPPVAQEQGRRDQGPRDQGRRDQGRRDQGPRDQGQQRPGVEGPGTARSGRPVAWRRTAGTAAATAGRRTAGARSAGPQGPAADLPRDSRRRPEGSGDREQRARRGRQRAPRAPPPPPRPPPSGRPLRRRRWIHRGPAPVGPAFPPSPEASSGPDGASDNAGSDDEGSDRQTRRTRQTRRPRARRSGAVAGGRRDPRGLRRRAESRAASAPERSSGLWRDFACRRPDDGAGYGETCRRARTIERGYGELRRPGPATADLRKDEARGRRPALRRGHQWRRGAARALHRRTPGAPRLGRGRDDVRARLRDLEERAAGRASSR